ncbi:MAG TPA: hypothetical protein VFN55_08575 [Solirubrobacteraceae bacterium]|nr:hypothetical protein [Solirubrobacteraceae bacterium]
MAAARIALAAVLSTLAACPVALAGPASTNSDGDVLVFSAGVTPPMAGTAKVPQGIGLSLDAFVGNRISAGAAIPTNSITLSLPAGMTENGLRFPACPITPDAISACPRASQVGSGTAETEVLNPGNEPPTFTTATAALYNGLPLTPGAVPTLAFILRVGGRPAGELDFAVRPSPRGLQLSQVLVATAGPGIGITKVSLTVPDRTVTVRSGRRTSTVHFLTAPTTCTGAWTFGLTTTSAGRRPMVATDREPCVPAAPVTRRRTRRFRSAQPVSRLRSAAVSGL